MPERRLARAGSLSIVLLLLAACSQAPLARRFDGLGTHHFPITTESSDAQAWFDQGLILCYAFNHDEAVRAFRAAQHADPRCAMAHWGEGYALGPNINAPLTDPEVARQAHAAAQRALALRDGAAPLERALIEALAPRYADPPPADRAPLDRAYADAMRSVWQRFPAVADAGALFAEALLDTNPWNQWTKTGEPIGDTPEIVATLEAVLERHPDHAGANHFYIHAVEASKTPERGVPSARRLAALVPGAGHLVHMPAHIWARVGDYAEAEECNRRAVAVDRAYFAKVGPQGIYEFYRAHNHHFLVWSAMCAGRFEVARSSARDLVADLPPALLRDMAAFADGFLPVELHVLVRFGKWDEVLAVPDFAPVYPIARTMRRYARGVALSALGRAEQARAEQRAFESEAANVSADATIGINPALPVVDVARHMLEGEVLFREGKHDAAFAALRAAVEREDKLRYDEPPPWMMPVRHALGALLLQVGRVAEAEAVYRADLERLRENGWSLHGLAECLERLGSVEAEGVRERLGKAWARADTALRGSCFCRTGG